MTVHIVGAQPVRWVEGHLRCAAESNRINRAWAAAAQAAPHTRAAEWMRKVGCARQCTPCLNL
jgi:hypothetical protein